jgi:hypothetical protein
VVSGVFLVLDAGFVFKFNILVFPVFIEPYFRAVENRRKIKKMSAKLKKSVLTPRNAQEKSNTVLPVIYYSVMVFMFALITVDHGL